MLIGTRSKHIKGSKERCLFGQDTTCKIFGESPLQSNETTLSQLNGEKRWKMRQKAKPFICFWLSCASHVLQRNHRFRSLLSFWATTPLRSFPFSPLFVRHTHAQTPTIQPQNPWLSHFLTPWPPHLEQYPPRHQATLSSFRNKLKTFLFSKYFS